MIRRALYSTVLVLVAALAAHPASATPVAHAPAASPVSYRGGLLVWERTERRRVVPQTITRLSLALDPGRSKLLRPGRPGIVELRVYYAQREGGRVYRRVLSRRAIRAAKPRIVAQGIGAAPLTQFEARGLLHMAALARGAMHMLATGYTADSAGGSGWTAIGRRAGYGIVAVDPRIIPLGTRLFIPGYGVAVAGDTGGDIVGRRIDLGFDSLHSAMLFGRRDVTVYQLKR